MATALYRRYRPEGFSEMIGQAHVTEPLMTALRNGRIGHAYLFSGPRGCGKTTSARVLARCLNCAEGPTDTPCGVCPSCVELSRAGGGSLDVVEIDAASHGGVDDARELRERAVFAPARDRFKIFIIDEAHMVTPGGFNALLKIVEEPPPHVKFIFATTEPEKVIGTIRSRTHHYPFRLIAPAALITYAQSLCDSEGVDVEPGVLPLVVRAGGGSVRDTLSILDQLIAGSEEGRVSTERAAGLLGFTSSELLDEVVVALAASDAAAAFRATDRVVQTGQDPRRFVEDLLERLRDLIVISATSIDGAAAVFRGVPEAQLQRMFEQTQAFGRGELSRLADTVSTALDKMAGATAPRLHLELMIARALATAVPASGPAAVANTAPAPGAAPGPTRSSMSAQGAASASASVPAAGSVPASGSVSTSGLVPAAGSAPPSAPAPVASEPAPDIISTLRAAREFLRSDSAGAGSAGPANAGSTAGSNENQPRVAPPLVEPVTLDELREVWADLLEEILEQDRDAWNAVRPVVPLELHDDVLTIGIASQSDLESFKSVGAGPLREAISAAIGLTVRYVPKQLPAGAPGVPPASSPEAPGALDGLGEAAEDPDPAGNAEIDPISARLSALIGGIGAAATKPPVSEPRDATFTPDRNLQLDPSFPPELVGEAPDDPYAGLTDEPPPEFDDARDGADPLNGAGTGTRTEHCESPSSGQTLAQAETVSKPDPPEARPMTNAPTFTRYGESVVREVLGAKFIEEIPLSKQYDS